MGKIRGKFAPLMDELGEDPRWLMECNDTEKFLYMLILFTIYTTNGTAPEDPNYYKTRYNLGHRKDNIRAAIEQLKIKFPKLVCSNKKLSLINSTIYKNRVATDGATEEEVEEEVEEEREKDKTNSLSVEKIPKPEESFKGEDAFWALWAQYPPPGRIDILDSKEVFIRAVVAKDYFDEVLKALGRYRKHLEKHTWKQPMNFLTWFQKWRNWENFEEVEEAKKTKLPDPNHSACKGTGYLSDNAKCWCWEFRFKPIQKPEESFM